MRKLFVASTLSALTACTSISTIYGGNEVREHWSKYTSDSLNTQQLGEQEALAVLYRPTNLQGPAINVYINGRYQASIIDSGYTPIQVCAEKALFTASFSTNQGFGNRTDGIVYALPVKQKTFIRMTTNQLGDPIFERVSEEEANADMPFKGKVAQTLSRVNSHCDQPIVIKNEIMNSQAIWDVDKFKYEDISSEGKENIHNLINFIKQYQQEIGHIEVNGYTDPEASEAYNLSLSQKRAEAIRQMLVNAGITLPIQAVGYGKQNLIAANCSTKPTVKERNQCNAPNRRVEITVFKNR